MNDPYHVYMDLDVINNDYNTTQQANRRWGLKKPETPRFYQATVQTTSAVLFASMFKRATHSLSLYLGFRRDRVISTKQFTK